MLNLAIRGDRKNGSKIRELLKKLGGENSYEHPGTKDGWYTNHFGKIMYMPYIYEDKEYISYTLEEFKTKFPFDINDSVYYNGGDFEITNMKWNNVEETMSYNIKDKVNNTTRWVLAEDITLKETFKIGDLVRSGMVIMPVNEIVDNDLYGHIGYYPDTDQLIEMKMNGFMEECKNVSYLEKEKFFQKLLVTYLTEYPIEKEYFTDSTYHEISDRIAHKLGFEIDDYNGYPYIVYEIREYIWRNIVGEEVSYDVNNYLKVQEPTEDGLEIVVNENFEIKEKDGHFYLVEKQSEYPKNYDECHKILGLTKNDKDYSRVSVTLNEFYVIHDFVILKRCRDAYWKVAGEQMGLDEPWNPDWEDNYQKKWLINFYQGEINFTSGTNVQFFLAFPTEEMRDKFYENFKHLIESCKELI